MASSHSEPALEELCAELVRVQDRFQGDGPLARDCEDFLDSADALAHGRRRTRAWVFAASALVLGGSGALWFSQSVQEPTVLVGAARVAHRPGAWLAAADHHLPVVFADGSNVELVPEARVRIIDLGVPGAHLTLEMGRLRAWVVAGATDSWRFDAGPFRVTAAKTQFLLSWDPEAQLFEITVSQGSVSVHGPTLGESKLVEPGHRLRVSVPDSLAVLTTMAEAAGSAAR